MTLSGPTLGVIVVGAGSGRRLGASVPKAFVSIGGLTLIARSVDTVLRMAELPQLVVVAPADRLDEAAAEVRQVAGDRADAVRIVAGGATRQASVSAGLAALAPSVTRVLVHDAARALMPVGVLEAVAAAIEVDTPVGIVPGVALVDSVKRAAPDGTVLESPDRAELRAVQTPQGFPRQLFERAHAEASAEFSDDAALFAAAGHSVRVVAGDPLGFKITTPWDIQKAETLLGQAGASSVWRTGIGVDVHAYDDGSPLWLGGLYWPDEVGLDGHSDGDALSHAVCDALLSAAGLGDIGTRFGVDAEKYRDAHGDVFLTETLRLVEGAGFRVGNVSVQLIGNRPRLAPRRAEIEARLSELLGAPVSVSGTTSDGLGFTGRGEGITAIATALLAHLPER